MKNCNCDTEINRDGSGQLQRYLKALDPSYAPIDDRSTEDLLVFAKRYAAQIRFYDIPESKINDSTPVNKISWREFFRRDMAVIASSIALTHAEEFKKEYDEVTERLHHHTTPDVYAALYAPIVGMIKKIDRWYSVAIPENPLYADLKLAIDSDLKQQVQKIMAYEEGFKFVDPSVDLKIDLNTIENKEVWGLNETVPPDASIYIGTTQQEKILSASLYSEDIFHAFYNFLNKLIKDSEKYMEFAMEQYPSHQPHMALFITFLQLFNKAQEQMNGLTGRLLDFYYQEVLHLETKPSVPDKAHIVFELAKDVAEYDLASGTALKAGSDKSGKEQVYKTTMDLVVNQAKVKELKTIFIEKKLDEDEPPGLVGTSEGSKSSIKAIYARPISNSADGYGEKFPDTDIKWPTFGIGSSLHKIRQKNICQSIDKATELRNSKNETKIGFAIASPQLVLQGGNRIIAVNIPELKTDISKAKLEIWLSAEDAWLKIDNNITAKIDIIKKLLKEGGDLSTGMPTESGYFFDFTKGTLYICLPIVEKAIVPFNLALHPGRTYTTSYPVMQVMLGYKIEIEAPIFNTLSIDKLSLSVRVGSINVSENTILTFKGKVTHQEGTSTKALGEVAVIVTGKKVEKVMTGEDGTFELKASIGNIIYFYKKDYKQLFIRLNNNDDISVNMTQGTGLDSSSIFPSFFDGLKQLTLQNDDGLIPSNKPFDPFTAYPKFGSSLYIGGDEVFNKPLDELAIHIKHLSDTSDVLFDSILGIATFYKLSLLEKKEWIEMCTSFATDFSEGMLTQNILFDKNKKNIITERLPLSYSTELRTQTIKGFIQLKNMIPTDLFDNSTSIKDSSTEGAASGTSDANSQKDVFQKMAELAVLLKVKEISISYFSQLTSLNPEIDQFFHVYPFGVTEIYSKPIASKITLEDGNKFFPRTSYDEINTLSSAFKQLDAAKDYLLVNASQLLLPQFTYLGPYEQSNTLDDAQGRVKTPQTAIRKDKDILAVQLMLSASGLRDKITGGANQYSGTLQEEGMLFIGIEKAQPLQMISMLFQFAEGSAADEDSDPPEIHWSYLTNNEWRPLKEESIVSDGTIGFQTTGIVKIELPEDATNNNTIITTGLHWLSASVTKDSDRVPMLINVVTQAVLANFEDNNNDPSHFDTALAAGSISKLAVAVAQVSKVQQPFASYDGKHKEIGKEFYTRASERLRHKARAITPWDYEHLVLDRFPSIYKMKCITHTDPNCLCREPEEGTTLSTSSSCSIGKVDLTYDEDKATTLTGDNQKNLEEIINKMKPIAGGVTPTCKIKITGFYKKGNPHSYDFNTTRLKNVEGSFTKATPQISQDRFYTVFLQTEEEKNTIHISEISPVAEACCGPQIAPGHVLLIPISNLKNRNAVNQLQPKTSRRVLLDIEAYLKKRTSPFVHVHAKNPEYEQVLVSFKVKFREGYDKGFYMKKLNEEIVHYLTPWAFDDTAEVQFGQKIYASSIINFIEERVYVDFITDFLMIVCRNGCCDELIENEGGSHNDKDLLNKIAGCADMEILLQDKVDFMGDIIAKPSTARSLLVSAPKHIIIPYQETKVKTDCEKRKEGKAKNKNLAGEHIKNESVSKNLEMKIIVPVPVEVVTDVLKNTDTLKSTDSLKSIKKPVVEKQPPAIVKKGKKNTKNK